MKKAVLLDLSMSIFNKKLLFFPFKNQVLSQKQLASNAQIIANVGIALRGYLGTMSQQIASQTKNK